MKKIINFIKEVFTKDYWVKEFPDIPDDECFMCNKGSCEGCLVISESTEERLINQSRCDAGMFLS